MTCIAGIATGGAVYLAGDSAGVAGWDLVIRADQKVFRNGDFVMGFTSSFRMGQLLRYAFQPPKHDPSVDVYQYMVTTFVDAVRDCLIAGGVARKESEQESGGTFLVGYQGRLFSIHEDYQVRESECGFDAVGCGAQVALGALYAASHLEPIDRLKLALDAAEAFSVGVRAPFVFLSSKAMP